MSRLFRYFEGYKLSSIFGPLMKLVEAVLELLIPMIVALIIDVAIPTGDVTNIIKYILVMFGIAATGLAFSITAQFLSAKAAVGFAENLTNDLFEFGKTQIEVESVKINIYDEERMIVELIRKKNLIFV